MSLRWLVVHLAIILSAGLVLGACGSDDDDDDDDGERTECTGDDPLAIDSADRTEGLNIVEQTVVLSGGCYDDNTTAALIDEAGVEREVGTEAAFPATLTVTLPAGLEIGNYTIRVARADLTAETDWTAMSEIIVGGLYEGAFHVLDVSDKTDTKEVAVIQPWPDDVNKWIGHPTVNHQGLRVYFWDDVSDTQGGIFGADLADGGNVQKITGNLVPFYHTPDASPTEAKVTYLGCSEVSNVCSIYIVGEDGTDETMLADVTETVEVNNDTTGSWGLWDPVFSPDGSKIAYLRETTCEGSTEPEGCDYDYYGLVMTMNADGSDKQIVYWEPGALCFSWLHWTPSGGLVWGRNDGDAIQFQLFEVGSVAPVTITPPAGSWNTEWNIWGEGIIWLAYSPFDDSMVLEPVNTDYAVYYPLTVTGQAAQSGAASLLNPPNPDAPGEGMGHYIEFDWFGLRP